MSRPTDFREGAGDGPVALHAGPTIEEIQEHLRCLRNIAEKGGLAGGSPGAGSGTPVLHREGQRWIVRYRGNVSRVRDSVGLRYLALLVEDPGQELTAGHLIAKARGRDRLPGPAHARRSVSRAIWTALGNLTRADPSLGEHLARAIRLGAVCRYEPDPRSGSGASSIDPAPEAPEPADRREQ